jgi:hypothetical protein
VGDVGRNSHVRSQSGRCGTAKEAPTERKAKDDLVDWRDKVEFWSEWEVLETPVPCDRFRQTPERNYMYDTDQRHEQDIKDNKERFALEKEDASEESAGLADDEGVGGGTVRQTKEMMLGMNAPLQAILLRDLKAVAKILQTKLATQTW